MEEEEEKKKQNKRKSKKKKMKKLEEEEEEEEEEDKEAQDEALNSIKSLEAVSMQLTRFFLGFNLRSCLRLPTPPPGCLPGQHPPSHSTLTVEFAAPGSKVEMKEKEMKNLLEVFHTRIFDLNPSFSAPPND
ncbi:hypothetical protein RUM44_006005 [Polyplax serrata]|uniref:Uncharacterized protein n=1 Tax=Polyplax serrata TaxID=468196 RepID=A0ABR1AYQ0_POLSC